MPTVSQLIIYPVKSMAGVALTTARVTDRGLAHDRRYMLVTPQGRCITIRQHPELALLQPRITGQGLEVVHRLRPRERLIVPPPPYAGAPEEVTVFSQTMLAVSVGRAADEWFAKALGVDCRLVYMPEESRRPVAPSSGLRPPGKITSFSDGYPFLLIGEASLADLNQHHPGQEEVEMARFRPNIVVAGTAPYAEDNMGTFAINGITFNGLEKCARCNVPNVDPVTAVPSPEGEPLATLSQYRKDGRKIYFGVNLVHSGEGWISVGDTLSQT